MKLILTDEDIIQSAIDYMAKYPNAGRNKVVLNTRGDTNRIRALVKANKIKLPPPQKPGKAWAKHFKIDPASKHGYSDAKGSIL